ncbi:hypothetical protein D9619_011065 [Psilocybe cf. subviscida]|uniref:Uncharacterized protein n=1 Tax=Psilocybe cf. subviscida TaxID=2480587 RepID=A0A8H5F093_9AGAR|nr:hypothetical protein D9619_011065 [Psilocybe cf. subviscida]
MAPTDGLQQKYRPRIWYSGHWRAESVCHTAVTAPPHEASTKMAKIPGPGAETPPGAPVSQPCRTIENTSAITDP